MQTNKHQICNFVPHCLHRRWCRSKMLWNIHHPKQ